MRDTTTLMSIMLAGSLMLISGCDEKNAEPTAEVTPAALTESSAPAPATPEPKPEAKVATPDKDAAAAARDAARKAAAQAGLGGSDLIEFDDTRHDFGKVSDTETLTHAFVFRNKGASTLVIRDVKTSCGCTTTKLARQEFAPGEGDKIEIKFKPKGGGKQTKYITVITNDEKQPQVKLAISADVIPVVGLAPRSLQFGTVDRGNTETLRAKVTSVDPSFKIKSVTVKGENVSANIIGEPVKMESASASGEVRRPNQIDVAAEQEIEIVLHDDAPTGRFFRQITVIATAAAEEGQPQRDHTQTLLVHANVVGDIQTQPQFVRVPVLNQGDDFSNDLIVTRRSGEPFKILDVEIQDSNLTGVNVATEPYNVGGISGYKITVTGNAGTYTGSFRGNIVVVTDVPKEGETKVMFNGVVRAPRPATRPVTRPVQGPTKPTGK